MLNIKPYSANLLASSGGILIFIGLYFIFLRPAILPEDLSYIGSSLQNIKSNVPGLLPWLQKVFWVMGGYIFSTGLLISFIGLTTFRKRLPGSFAVAAVAGVGSIGLMTVVNFMIDSEFKWLLLIFTLPWIMALIFYRLHK